MSIYKRTIATKPGKPTKHIDMEPSEAEKHSVEEQKRLHEAESRAFNDLRAEAYDPIVEQIDDIWHAINNGTLDKNSRFYLRRKAVKDRITKS